MPGLRLIERGEKNSLRNEERNFRYHKQAAIDAEAVWRRTVHLLRQLGLSSDAITEKDVKLFCRYASDIHVQRGTCIADEYDPKTINASKIGRKRKRKLLQSAFSEPFIRTMTIYDRFQLRV